MLTVDSIYSVEHEQFKAVDTLWLWQFGPGPAMQQHGFARNSDWTVSATSADLQPDERDPSVELTLTDNDYTRSMW